MSEFEENYIPEPNTGCYLWLKGKSYGVFKGEKAHRYAWKLVYGAIPRGKVICHSCDNPHCVNIEHLWMGTQRLNMLDKALKGRARNGRKREPCQLEVLDLLVNLRYTLLFGIRPSKYPLPPTPLKMG